MRHSFTVNSNKLTVEFTCQHPEGLQGGSCPTGYGDCLKCSHCTAEMSAADFLILRELAKESV